MFRATRRRLGSPAWLAAGFVLVLPALAEAQLFPNRTIRRERPPCTSETPFNAQVRRDYFGYYPTCWSKFPAGWGCPCPNPELPDFAASKLKEPLDTEPSFSPPPEDGAGMGGFGDPTGTGRGGNTGEPAIDPPPRGGDLFNPKPQPPITPGQPDPFLKPPANPPRPGASSSLPPAPRNAPAGLMEMPDLPDASPPVGRTSASTGAAPSGAMVMIPDATLASNSTSTSNPTGGADFDRPNFGPLPNAPLPPSSNPGPVAIPDPTESDQLLARPLPAQAPRRRSLLGSLFNRNNTQNR